MTGPLALIGQYFLTQDSTLVEGGSLFVLILFGEKDGFGLFGTGRLWRRIAGCIGCDFFVAIRVVDEDYAAVGVLDPTVLGVFFHSVASSTLEVYLLDLAFFSSLSPVNSRVEH